MSEKLKNLLDKVRPKFQPGGKLEKWHTAYDAFESFLFVPGNTSNKGVHIRDAMDLKRTMITVVISIIPCLLFGMWNVGYQHFRVLGIPSDLWQNFFYGMNKVMPLVAVTYISGLTFEFLFASLRKHQVNEGFLVTGILIPLIIPVTTPLWMVAVATIFAVIIGKEVFGGTGMNIMNPALVARAFLFFAYPTYLTGNDVWIAADNSKQAALVDGYSGETPLALAVEGGAEAIPSFWDSFIGIIPGSVGETSALACLLGAAILIYTGVGSLRLLLPVFLGGYLMALLLNILAVNPFMTVPAHHQLVLGGFAFGAVFMVTEPVTAPQTNVGKYIYSFLTGVLAILIRVLNPAFPEGMMLAILFMNIMAPLIDHYVVEANVKKRIKRSGLMEKSVENI